MEREEDRFVRHSLGWCEKAAEKSPTYNHDFFVTTRAFPLRRYQFLAMGFPREIHRESHTPGPFHFLNFQRACSQEFGGELVITGRPHLLLCQIRLRIRASPFPRAPSSRSLALGLSPVTGLGGQPRNRRPRLPRDLHQWESRSIPLYVWETSLV